MVIVTRFAAAAGWDEKDSEPLDGTQLFLPLHLHYTDHVTHSQLEHKSSTVQQPLSAAAFQHIGNVYI